MSEIKILNVGVGKILNVTLKNCTNMYALQINIEQYKNTLGAREMDNMVGVYALLAGKPSWILNTKFALKA